jgi:hypothetical protein
MTNPLRIEVTEGMRDAAEAAFCNSSVKFDRNGNEPDLFTPALTAAFQHPEFRQQFLAQLKDAVPANMNAKNMGIKLRHGEDWVQGWNEANDATRANLAGLLGVENG